jgi:hypothetical protein
MENDVMSVPTPDEITEFLKQAKLLISRGNRQFQERKKNRDSIGAMGLTIEQAWTEMLRLTYRDYVDGPVLDDNPRYAAMGHCWWIFGLRVEDLTVYVKLRISASKVVVCLSFHEAQFPIKFPYESTLY